MSNHPSVFELEKDGKEEWEGMSQHLTSEENLPEFDSVTRSDEDSIFNDDDLEYTESKNNTFRTKFKKKIEDKWIHKPKTQQKIGDVRGSRGPRVIESKLNSFTRFSFNDWKEILKYEKKENVSHSVLLNSLRKGVPNELRPRIWAFLANTKELMEEHGPNYYAKLVSTASKDDNQILLDIPRTDLGLCEDCTTAEKEEYETRIFNVLRALVNFDPTVGYVQGMNHIAAALSYNLHPSHYKNTKFSFGSKLRDEEETVFWIMVYIMQTLNWRDAYTHQFLKMKRMMSAFEFRLKENMRKVYRHLVDNCYINCEGEISLFDLVFPDFQTLLLRRLPLKYSARVLDLILLEGEKVILDIYQRMFYLCQHQILKMDKQEQLLQFLKKEMIDYIFESKKDKLEEIFPFTLTQKLVSTIGIN